jgi:hypothetical protein
MDEEDGRSGPGARQFGLADIPSDAAAVFLRRHSSSAIHPGIKSKPRGLCAQSHCNPNLGGTEGDWPQPRWLGETR